MEHRRNLRTYSTYVVGYLFYLFPLIVLLRLADFDLFLAISRKSRRISNLSTYFCSYVYLSSVYFENFNMFST